jgi:alpha-tubulin suppressor-like RCC1 family protein
MLPALAACGAGNGMDPASRETTGEIEASLTQIPTGVLCVQITTSRGGGATSLNVTSGSSSAALSIGPLPIGTTTVQATAYNVACASVTPTTTPDWVGAPATVDVKAGANAKVSLILTPSVATTVSVNFVSPAVALGPGKSDTWVISATGSIRGWGYDQDGEVGDGGSTDRLSPVAIASLPAVSSISGGGSHACAVTTPGALQCWGTNFYGMLGDGTTTDRLNPVVSIASNVKQVSAGSNYTCVVKTDKTIWCAGYNGLCELGNGGTANSSSFISIGTGFEQVVTGNFSTCARSADSSVWCWGYNGYGQVGNGTTSYTICTPTQVPSFTSVAEVATDWYHACARKYDGTVWCWGHNGAGELGDGTTVDRSSPVQVLGINSAAQLALSQNSSCARLQDGTVRCWGSGAFGILGDGSGKDSSTPVAVRNLSGALEIVSGDLTVCARLDTGAVQCWGYNLEGEVGDGSGEHKFLPTNVSL